MTYAQDLKNTDRWALHRLTEKWIDTANNLSNRRIEQFVLPYPYPNELPFKDLLRLSINSWDAQFMLHRAEIIEISGPGKWQNQKKRNLQKLSPAGERIPGWGFAFEPN